MLRLRESEEGALRAPRMVLTSTDQPRPVGGGAVVEGTAGKEGPPQTAERQEPSR